MNSSNPITSFDFIWSIAKNIWPLFAIVAAIKLVQLIPAILRNKKLAASGIADIDVMDGKTFEDCLGALFARQGYKVEVTPYKGDWGGDLVIVKDGVRTVVQAKRYKKAVGVRAVQEVVAAMPKYHCTQSMVVTNAVFTKQAQELARVNKVHLWNRDTLVEKLLTDKKAQIQKPTRQKAA